MQCPAWAELGAPSDGTVKRHAWRGRKWRTDTICRLLVLVKRDVQQCYKGTTTFRYKYNMTRFADVI